MAEKIYLVKNRSASKVYYSVPELGIKLREFQPNETKRITAQELEGLSYLPGGNALIRDYLFISDEKLRDNLVGNVEPEYNMSVEDVKQLILYGSMDEWLDCLDFAPEGVIDLVKTLSVELPLTNTEKMRTFKEKQGTDLAQLIRIRQEDKQLEEAEQNNNSSERRTRRTEKKDEQPEEQPVRRTSGSKYKVVSK